MRASFLALTLALLISSGARAGEPLPPGLRSVNERGAVQAAGQGTCPKHNQRLVVVVHGINPVHADLDALCRDLGQRDYEVLRFVYDDSASLLESARGMRQALANLQRASQPKRLAVVAHSMGGLVSRRALGASDITPPQRTQLRRTYRGGRWVKRRVPAGPAPAPLPPLRGHISFLTVASPFGGFRSANWARLDFGLGRAVYRDLGTRASFICKPGQLAIGVSHVKVETNEEGHQRHDGKSDHSVPLKSQTQKVIDATAREVLRLDLGHVGSVRDLRQEVPLELRAILTRVLGRRRAKAPRARASGLVSPLQGLGG